MMLEISTGITICIAILIASFLGIAIKSWATVLLFGFFEYLFFISFFERLSYYGLTFAKHHFVWIIIYILIAYYVITAIYIMVFKIKCYIEGGFIEHYF